MPRVDRGHEQGDGYVLPDVYRYALEHKCLEDCEPDRRYEEGDDWQATQRELARRDEAWKAQATAMFDQRLAAGEPVTVNRLCLPADLPSIPLFDRRSGVRLWTVFKDNSIVAGRRYNSVQEGRIR